MRISTSGVVGFVAVACLGVTSVMLSGCRSGGLGWSTYPAVEGEGTLRDPNLRPLPATVVAALSHVIDKYPPATPGGRAQRVTVNLPRGFTPEVYASVIERLNNRLLSDIEVVALTPATADLPTYHIARTRVRVAEAKVDVLRPVVEFGVSPDGVPDYQPLTVWMYSDGRDWYEKNTQFWTVNSVPLPPVSYDPSVMGDAPAEGAMPVGGPLEGPMGEALDAPPAEPPAENDPVEPAPAAPTPPPAGSPIRIIDT